MLEDAACLTSVHKSTSQGRPVQPESSHQPEQQIPSIVDPEGPDGKPLTLMESGRSASTSRQDRQFLPRTPRAVDALQWLMFQMGGVGRVRPGASFHAREEARSLRQRAATARRRALYAYGSPT